MSTLRDLLNARATTAAAVALDTTKLAADQAVVASDQAVLSTDQAADSAAAVAIAHGIATEPGNTGFVIDPTPNEDGTYTLYVEDTSPTGYHTVNIVSVDAPLPS